MKTDFLLAPPLLLQTLAEEIRVQHATPKPQQDFLAKVG